MGRRPKPPPPPPPPPAPAPPPTPIASAPIKQAQAKTTVKSPQQVVKMLFGSKKRAKRTLGGFLGLGRGLF